MPANENSVTFTETAPPEWLLAMCKEIDDKTFGAGSIVLPTTRSAPGPS